MFLRCALRQPPDVGPLMKRLKVPEAQVNYHPPGPPGPEMAQRLEMPTGMPFGRPGGCLLWHLFVWARGRVLRVVHLQPGCPEVFR